MRPRTWAWSLVLSSAIWSAIAITILTILRETT